MLFTLEHHALGGVGPYDFLENSPRDVWHESKHGQHDEYDPELASREHEEHLISELWLEERGQGIHVAEENNRIVEGEADEAGDKRDRVPEGRLQEQLVDDDVDDHCEGDRRHKEVVRGTPSRGTIRLTSNGL